jgi:hypothetical protein
MSIAADDPMNVLLAAAMDVVQLHARRPDGSCAAPDCQVDHAEGTACLPYATADKVLTLWHEESFLAIVPPRDSSSPE